MHICTYKRLKLFVTNLQFAQYTWISYELRRRDVLDAGNLVHLALDRLDLHVAQHLSILVFLHWHVKQLWLMLIGIRENLQLLLCGSESNVEWNKGCRRIKSGSRFSFLIQGTVFDANLELTFVLQFTACKLWIKGNLLRTGYLLYGRDQVYRTIFWC